MLNDDKPLRIQVQTVHATTGVNLTDVSVEAVVLECERSQVVAQALTGAQGVAILDLPHDAWRQRLLVRMVAGPEEGVDVSRAAIDGEAPTVLEVTPAPELDRDHLALLADQLVATRRVRAEDLASDLAAPTADSVVRVLSAGVRARLLTDLDQALQRADAADRVEMPLVDPAALRDGHLRIVPIRELPHLDLELSPATDIDLFTKPGAGWDLFPWAKPDDESYRDYLRSVFVLFAHQQKLGVGADPNTFPGLVERQLTRRFFQDFRTADRTEVPLDRLLVPLVTAVLTASDGSGFGFKIPAAALPAQGTHTDRQYLDALLALAPVGVQEFANRYRMPLTEPDSVTSSPVKLNIYTLSRILSDTAQGPVEPPENVIEPQLPGVEGKPILWTEVVGSAPFFLRFDEWLARQQPFFAENLFALRTQVVGASSGPWLTDGRKKFLEYHKALPSTQSLTPYNGYFGSMGEVQRSATFLLAYGDADLKLTELVNAIDKNQFATAARLADDAKQLLNAAHPSPSAGETWEPELSVGNFPRPLSLNRRRKLKVSNITELAGVRGAYPPDGFERFFDLEQPEDLWKDVVLFRIARDQATRLRTYQLRFLLPMLRATIRAGLGDLPGTVDMLAGVTGFYIGIAMLGTPAGMVRHPDSLVMHTRVVAGRLRLNDPLGDRPYTARLTYDSERQLDGPFSLTPQLRGPGSDVLIADPPLLHPLEQRYARIVQADALLAWAETLYRTDDAASLERARELYKAVIFLHGEEPGTSAYLPSRFLPPSFVLIENPRVRNQIDRARLALHQLDAGLNFYGYNDDAVPTLRYDTLVGAAQRWAVGAKSAQTDYLAYLGRVEQLDLDLLAAKAQEQKARATVAIAAEQIEIAKAGVVVAKKLVTDVEKLIAAKQAEIADANSLFTQFGDYFSGMKSSVSSMVDIGKGASEGWTSLSTSGVGDALGLGSGGGASGGASGGAAAGSESVGLGSAMGGLGVVGGFAAFAVLSTTTLQGMADAATTRQGELMALTNEALPAAHAAVRVQERNVTIANLHGQIAATDLAYARDLVNYQNERFLNRDFWEALAGVARRSLHRYLDLAGQGAWFAERALAYRLATPIRVIRIGYFDARMRDVGGVDRLALDLAELEALRLAAARVTVPLTVTYSLSRDLPLAFGQLKASGTCNFTLTDDALMTAHPGTFAHRIRAVDVQVDAPGTAVPARGILTNSGFSLLRRESTGPRVPLLRFADAYPVSEFRLRADMALHGLPGEHLLPFEGAGFTTTWTLELPKASNPVGLNRITDVRITFDVQGVYEVPPAAAALAPQPVSRAVFVSALAIDSTGLKTLRTATQPQGTITFGLDRLALPANAVITNLAVVLPGVDGGTFQGTLRFGGTAPTSFDIDDGLAMSNAGVLSDGNPANVQPLNAAAKGSAARPAIMTITKGTDAARLAAARDALLWVEYSVP
jgi:Tc toxin complex TcA C-terminal TcB-binding domain